MRCLPFGKKKRKEEVDEVEEDHAFIDDATSYSFAGQITKDVGIDTQQAAAGETQEKFQVVSDTQCIEIIPVPAPVQCIDLTTAGHKNDPSTGADSSITNQGASPPNISNTVLPPDVPPNSLMTTMSGSVAVSSLPPREAGRHPLTIQHRETASLTVKGSSPRQVPHSEREDKLSGRTGANRRGSGAVSSSLDQITTHDSAPKVNADPEARYMMEALSERISESTTYTGRLNRTEHGTQTRSLRKTPKIVGRPENDFCHSDRWENCCCDGLRTVPCAENCTATVPMYCKPCGACSIMMPLDVVINGFHQPYPQFTCAYNNCPFQRPCRSKLLPDYPYKRFTHCPFGCTTHSGWNAPLQPFANWNAKPSYVTMEISHRND
ncbi:unnamed protein product [Calicophoron daubneyi]|uniref:Uncharacterized protein n=1 Tax=Calicophoron daubneyi TaxID=300641 RepID=A0AAV2T9D5_CALDB